MQFKLLLLALLVIFIACLPIDWLANNVDSILSNFPEDGLQVSFQQGQLITTALDSTSPPILIAAH